MQIIGFVRTGLGRGKKFMPVYAALFLEHLGFEPFHGTLNLSVDETVAKKLESISKHRIPAFTHSKHSYGAVDYIPARVHNIECALIFPLKSIHPKTIVEIIAPIYLRDALEIIDGDKVKVQLEESK